MRIATWDSGLRFDDPNLYWGDPSYLLEPGDPGYVDPSPPVPTTNPKPDRTMSNNEIPKNLKVALAMAEDAADGCNALEVAISLKSVKEADLRAVIVSLKGVLTPTPIPGLIGLYDLAKDATGEAKEALKETDIEVKRFLTDARDVLKKILGTAWSPEWVVAGYSMPGSTAVPGTQDARFASLASLSQYLTAHPTYEVPGGGVYPEVTSARATALHTQISNARALVNTRETAQEQAKNARDAGAATLRALLIALVDELPLRIGPADPRWETFGFNIPANPRPPEAASALTLALAGPSQVLMEWKRGRRSNNNRILGKRVGIDTEWQDYGKTGNVTEKLLKDLPAATTLRLKLIALNGSLEAPDGPEGEIAVP